MSSKGTLKIHSENILPIIKRWLYTDKDIFVRELIANASDACAKLKAIGQASDEELTIAISIDKEKRTLTFSDTGIGMSQEEVEKYIAEVAFSGAEEFVEKYKSDQQIIGHFGLGFFSAFMVADKVEIETLSYQQTAPAHWSCEGSAEYTLEEGKRSARGTDIILHLNDESLEYLDPAKLRAICSQHCVFLPFPIAVDGALINEEPPLWIKSPLECSDEEYLKFYRKLYPGEADPLLWVHLQVDYPFHLKGILYFPRLQRNFDFQKSNIRLYCNRMFVSDNCKDLIPDYLTALRGALDSTDIPLNVSRSSLQMDRTVRQLATHISKKVCERLSSLYKADRESFLKAWEDLELVVKLGALQDDKFYERVKEVLVWKTATGEWKTVEEALARAEGGKVFYTGEGTDSKLLELYKGKEVLCTHGAIDTHLIHFLERKVSGLQLQRIDGALDEAILDKKREKTLLDADGKTEATKLAELIKKALDADFNVEAKSLNSDELPALFVFDEQQRRMRDYLAVADPSGKHSEFLKGKQTLVVNTNNKLLGAIAKIYPSQPKLASQMLEQVVAGARIAQREMDPHELDKYLSRNHAILEQLVVKICES
ncbi:MAG: molecular chaperone HtpG [Verrucomicrobia bacterium]|nr:molecular chaperone HtpG [Verrucomicrobiota bacterium]